MRRDGTSIIFIQYCYSSEKRTNLNTGIAIPAKYWIKKRQTIQNELPADYGKVDQLTRELKLKLRFAKDLVELAKRKNIQNRGKFVKEAFHFNLEIDQLENNKEKIRELTGEKEKGKPRHLFSA